ncbi:MAG: N-acetyltransferase [Myxococcales bacterium]|nr:MAG: N-acetyltransferase [Myxococcales bacterium]
MNVVVKRMGPDLRDAFYALHSDVNDCGLCQCVAWWAPTWEGWDKRTKEENRALRESLFDRGEYDGYLLFVDDVPSAWCQAGPRDRLEKLCRSYRLTPDPAVWAITCFLVAPSARQKGLARRLLDAVLADLAFKGVALVQAFPKRGELPVEDMWTGPEPLFQAAGFTLERDDPRLPIYAKRLG